jgi:L-threonylcarbamoyladenylate synthase
MMQWLQARTPSGAPDSQAIQHAAGLLEAGGLVAIPTETVYGLAANALAPHAVQRIFEAKGRPSFNPLIVHVLDLAGASPLVSGAPPIARTLASAFWPGPLTLVLPRSPAVPDEVTGGLDTVAIRAPSHPVARALLGACRLPLAAPSANRSGGVSPTTAEHVARSLGGRIDAILDAGPAELGLESTVLDLTSSPPRLLRPGGVTFAQLLEFIPDLSAPQVDQDAGVRASPGLLSRHYAPDADTRLVTAAELEVVLATLPPTARVGGLAFEAPRPVDARIAAWERLGAEPLTASRRLYAALHRVEEAGCTHVLIEAPPAAPEWDALRDRVRRAAGPRS